MIFDPTNSYGNDSDSYSHLAVSPTHNAIDHYHGNGDSMSFERRAVHYEPNMFINRELSWLVFNERVLEEARDLSNPLLERLRFIAISSSNLDEFFEVRVAGLQAQDYHKLEPQDIPPDGMGPVAQLMEISKRVHDFTTRQYETWRDELRAKLADQGIVIITSHEDLTDKDNEFLDGFFDSNVYPVLTPLAIDPAHPFPHIHNKSLNLILRIEPAHEQQPRSVKQLYAVVQVPAVLNRLVELPSGEAGKYRFATLETVIGPRLDSLFGGFHVVAWAPFRVTRNSDLSIESEIKHDLLSTIRDTLRKRMWGDAVRLEIDHSADEGFHRQLRLALDLEERDIYKINGPLALSAFSVLCRLEGFRELKEPSFDSQVPIPFTKPGKIFPFLREQDLLVHHPYESFGAVIKFIEQAAEDPNVLAIKQTLYRISDDNPIIDALIRAAENGKQVTALVELQARLDEENNIAKARSLQNAGVHVVYGMVGLKTHCKAALVVRKELEGLRRYVHFSTGNYNHNTARFYTDLSFFTSQKDFGDDASALFNLLTGYSQGHEWQKLIIAPMDLEHRVINLIDQERKNAEKGLPARIIAKMNALVEPNTIEALYDASRAGVKIELVIRGICCLRPGVKGISENIRVCSIVDKFLEHSRISYFHNAGDPQVFLASADWMPRNFRRRVEVMFPIEDERLRKRVIEEVLQITLNDNLKARILQSDGTYTRVTAASESAKILRSQVEFQKKAKEMVKAESIRPVSKTSEPAAGS